MMMISQTLMPPLMPTPAPPPPQTTLKNKFNGWAENFKDQIQSLYKKQETKKVINGLTG